MIRLLYIASINRHGGSLLNRLFDSHPQVATLPTEMGFPRSKFDLDFMENLSGVPTAVPYIEDFDGDLLKFFNLDNEIDPIFKWGKERSDKIGVRKNYLEKAFYDNFKTDFNLKNFINFLKKSESNIKNINDIYYYYFKHYFENWDSGKHIKKFKYHVLHSSTGLFLDNFDHFFNTFKDSFVLVPVRNPIDYIASEKTRIARIFYGSRRFYRPTPPDSFIKFFDYYDLNALIRSWHVSVTRHRILQEDFGSNFFFYRYEDLVNKTADVMRNLSNLIGIDYNDILLKPTLIGESWGGNSHKGRLDKIELSNYSKKVLKSSEIEIIKQKTNLWSEIEKISEVRLDYRNINLNKFYDYENQKKLSSNKNMLNIYLSYAMNGARKKQVAKVGILGLLAFTFGLVVRIINIFRLIKQRLFPTVGKQNYT